MELRPIGGVAWRLPPPSRLIEAHFGALGRFTLDADDLDRITRRRVYRCLRYRHRRLGNSPPLNRIRSVRLVKLDQH